MPSHNACRLCLSMAMAGSLGDLHSVIKQQAGSSGNVSGLRAAAQFCPGQCLLCLSACVEKCFWAESFLSMSCSSSQQIHTPRYHA